jgi:5-methylcytosine-specific restriction protein A
MAARKKKARIVGSDLYPYIKDKDGKPLCRFCKGPIKPPRYTFCSDECVHEYKIRANREYARALVLKRDHGVCQCCGLNAVALHHKVHKRAYLCNRRPKRRPHFARRFEGIHGFKPRAPGGPYWEMDHKIPVANGGARLGLDNLQTLCLRCHYKKTADHARQRLKKKPQRGKKGR